MELARGRTTCPKCSLLYNNAHIPEYCKGVDCGTYLGKGGVKKNITFWIRKKEKREKRKEREKVNDYSGTIV